MITIAEGGNPSQNNYYCCTFSLCCEDVFLKLHFIKVFVKMKLFSPLN